MSVAMAPAEVSGRPIYPNLYTQVPDQPPQEQYLQAAAGDDGGNGDYILINISGTRYKTHLQTLQRFPGTLLGDPQKRSQYYDDRDKEFYFDRHRPSFDAILYFYQSGGRLKRPLSVPVDVFHEEIKFFELGGPVLGKYAADEGLNTRPWRFFGGIRALGPAVLAGVPEFACLFFFLLIGAIFFSTAVYYAELDEAASQFKSIPGAMWWAIITLTTVGYGDITPIGPWGKLVGGVCALAGLMTIILPIPVLVTNFQHFYQQQNKRKRPTSTAGPSKTEELTVVGNEAKPGLGNIMSGGQSWVYINVSGARYKTRSATLMKFPQTLLGNPLKSAPYSDPINKELFFDRDRQSFDAVLYYYQSGGQLQCPLNVPSHMFLEEIKFFQLGDDVIQKYIVNEGLVQKQEEAPSQQTWRQKLWVLLEYPESSIWARLMAIFSLAWILLYVIVMCMETLPEFKHYRLINGSDGLESIEEIDDGDGRDTIFAILRSICGIVFLVELIIRLIVSPKPDYFKDPMNYVDILAVLPSFLDWVALILTLFISSSFLWVLRVVRLLFMFRILRLIRVWRLFRPLKGPPILLRAVAASLLDLLCVYLLLVVEILIFALLLFVAESDLEQSHFRNYGDAVWCVVVTITTVGYGDARPIGVRGKLVIFVCVFVSVLSFLLSVPILVGRYAQVYSEKPCEVQAIPVKEAKPPKDEAEKETNIDNQVEPLMTTEEKADAANV